MKTNNAPKTRVFLALVAFVAMTASTLLVGVPVSAGGKVTKLAPPTITCGTSSPTTIEIQVCAGAQGAPAGFSIQWMKKADFVANGNVWPVCTTDPITGAEVCSF